MPFPHTRRMLALILLFLSLIAIVWGAWPAGLEQRRLAFSPAELNLEQGPGWQAVLTWPARIRTGDVAELRLAVEPNTPAQDGQVGRAAVPGGHLEARLELTGMPVSPPGEVSQALGLDAPTIFTWRVQPAQPGRYPATVWLHWAGNAAPARQVLSAQRLEWQAAALFGLSGPWARALGAAGVVIGIVFGLDGLASSLGRRFLRPQA